jgi:ADP-heptose:LPS heptosyltransferase
MALDLQGLWKSGVLTRLSGAPRRVGFAMRDCRERGNALFTNRRVPVPEGCHVVDANRALLAGLGIPPDAAGTPAFPIPVDAEAAARAERLFAQEGLKPQTPLVVLNPGSGGAGKRWAIEAYRRLGDELNLRLGARILVGWGPGEEPLARAIEHGLRVPPVVPPATSIPDMVALLRRAALVVGSDTGPIHVAAALGVPTLGLYGPTTARRNGPYGARTAAVQSPTGRMEDITVDAVLAATERLLG